MSQSNVEELETVTARIDLALKIRILKMKTDRTGNTKLPNTIENIIVAGLNEYLKKFGY